MTQATVNGLKVWEAMIQNPAFTSQPPAFQQATKPFVIAMPRVLEDFLEKPATWGNLLAAKAAFLRYCAENGFAEAIAPHVELPAGVMLSQAELIEIIQEGLVALVEALESDGKILSQMAEISQLTDLSEMTIGQILEQDPFLIFGNNPDQED